MTTLSAAQTPRLVVISGLSGSGKTIALHTLEDLGYYAIDNLPASLLLALAGQFHELRDPHLARIAIGIDARNLAEDLKRLPEILAAVRALGMAVEVVFLDADDSTLLKRYSETRRRHPLTQNGLTLNEAISAERALLSPVRALAALAVDTTDQNIHQLRRRLWQHFAEPGKSWALLIESFAYKRGIPIDADYVFDVRALPNPHWIPELRPMSGREAPVSQWLSSHSETNQMATDIGNFLERWLPRFDEDQRSYVTVAIGCTGGKHRSVYLVERVAEHLRATRETVIVFHRELA